MHRKSTGKVREDDPKQCPVIFPVYLQKESEKAGPRISWKRGAGLSFMESGLFAALGDTVADVFDSGGLQIRNSFFVVQSPFFQVFENLAH